MTTFPPFHLPFLFYHSHSTSLPFLSLFLALSSSSSSFSYKQQHHSPLQNTLQWGGTNPPLSLLHLTSYFPFSSIQGFQVFKEEGAVYTITTSHQASSPPSSSPWESRLLSYSREDLRVCDLRVLPTFHMVYFNLFFNYSF